MKWHVQITNPIPKNVGFSYGSFEFRKFGVCCWIYANDYEGEVEFINRRKFVTEPKYEGAVGLRYWFQPGIFAVTYFSPSDLPPVRDVILNGKAHNPSTGKNMPMRLPIA